MINADIVLLIAATGVTMSSFGIFYILIENHKFNKRQHAALLLSQWDDKMAEHRMRIEMIKPGLLDLSGENQKPIPYEQCERIYLSDPDTIDWELRFHFIQMLNFMESIASSYMNNLGDKRMLEKSFQNVLLRNYILLIYFIQVFREKRGHEGWEPFTDLMREWNGEPLLTVVETGQIHIIKNNTN